VRGWLIDTNVVSELRKAKPDPNVVAFVSAQPAEALFVSDVTFGEIVYGIEQIKDSARRTDIRSWLDHTLRPLFAGRVLPINEAVIVRWKTLAVAGQKRGHTFGQPDLFVAATAAIEDLVVVSRDAREFIEARVPVFDPWQSVLHIGGKTRALRALATIEAAIRANS
jgi:predicted nucleic acid-binding protein